MGTLITKQSADNTRVTRTAIAFFYITTQLTTRKGDAINQSPSANFLAKDLQIGFFCAIRIKIWDY